MSDDRPLDSAQGFDTLPVAPHAATTGRHREDIGGHRPKLSLSESPGQPRPNPWILGLVLTTFLITACTARRPAYQPPGEDGVISTSRSLVRGAGCHCEPTSRRCKPETDCDVLLRTHIGPDLPKPAECNIMLPLTYLLWNTFVAVQFPVDDPAKRGIPRRPQQDTCTRVDCPLSDLEPPRVWETWKQDFELFPAEGGQLPEWDSYEAARPPCDRLVDGQEVTPITPENWPGIYERYSTVLNKINLVESDAEPGAEPGPGHEDFFEFTGPVIDAHGKSMRYEFRFNRPFYECLRSPTCDAANMPAADEQQDGAIVIVAAWGVPAKGTTTETFYRRPVLVVDYDPEDDVKDPKDRAKVCRPEERELIAMNFAFKNSFMNGANQWIWTAFEHQATTGACPGSPIFSSPDGFSRKARKVTVDDPVVETEPVYLCQANSMECSTVCPNRAFRTELRRVVVGENPWKDFDVVALQWATSPTTRLPQTGVANTVLDAYVQRDSCMECHEGAKDKDFIWTMELAEYPDTYQNILR